MASYKSLKGATSTEKGLCEVMFVPASPSEHVEEYLEAIYLLEEVSGDATKVSSVSQRLRISPPSAVQMLKRLEKEEYLTYHVRKGVTLTRKGTKVGRRMVRNGRLIEVLMKEAFKIPIDPRVSCGIEHHMTEAFADALCTLLHHPPYCPHGNHIPSGKCHPG